MAGRSSTAGSIFAQPGKLLRLEGALGPLQDMAVTGMLSFRPGAGWSGDPDHDDLPGGGDRSRMDSAKLAPLVDQVMGIQLGRLRDFASGRPAGP